MEKQISSRYFKRLINQSLFVLILAKEKKITISMKILKVKI